MCGYIIHDEVVGFPYTMFKLGLIMENKLLIMGILCLEFY